MVQVGIRKLVLRIADIGGGILAPP
jgi:hypothetical protein